jgi:hypothetical protein
MAKGAKNARQREHARQKSIQAHGKETKHDKGGFALPWRTLCRAAWLGARQSTLCRASWHKTRQMSLCRALISLPCAKTNFFVVSFLFYSF